MDLIFKVPSSSRTWRCPTTRSRRTQALRHQMGRYPPSTSRTPTGTQDLIGATADKVAPSPRHVPRLPGQDEIASCGRTRRSWRRPTTRRGGLRPEFPHGGRGATSRGQGVARHVRLCRSGRGRLARETPMGNPRHRLQLDTGATDVRSTSCSEASTTRSAWRSTRPSGPT